MFIHKPKGSTSAKRSLFPDKVGTDLGLSMFPFRLSHHSEQLIAALQIALLAQEQVTSPIIAFSLTP